VRWLTEPLAYAFFTRALLASVLVGAMCGAVSVFVLLRRASYVGHGLAHSVLGGVAVGLALGVDVYVGAAAAAVISAVGINRVARLPGVPLDAAIGVVTTAMFALGVVVVVTATRTGRVSTEALLFGNVLAVRWPDVWLLTSTAATTAAVLWRSGKRLLLATLDPQVAGVQGVALRRSELLLDLLVAAVIVASVRVLGVLLIAAAVVVPAATARVMTGSIGGSFAVAIGTGTLAGLIGLYGSYVFDAPSGAAIVLAATGLFGLAVAGRLVSGRSRGSRAMPRISTTQS
jgi:manganese/iron transport system permease protein/iron/zinc/copper transport system permease protein